MSIKDRIKMFQSMSANNPDTSIKKPSVSQGVTSSSNNKIEKLNPNQSNNFKNNNISQSNTVVSPSQDNVILKPSDLKNKPSHLASTITKSQSVKPTTNQQPSWVKNVSINNSQPQKPLKKVQNQKYQVQTDRIAKPSEIRNKFNELVNQNKISFTPLAAKVEIKKVQSIVNTQQQAKKYEVQTTIPKISVKQNAQKFAAFYNSKSTPTQQNKDITVKPQHNQNINIHHQAIQPNNQQRQAQHSNNQTNLNIPNTIDLGYQPSAQKSWEPPVKNEQSKLQQIKKEQIKKQQIRTEPQNEESVSMLLRLKNKNKRKRLDFDDDED